ncbi:hypothetical protein FHS29_001867 [Saccharothrix tamanrassetensis]|uniref:Uncharacterized protein n=1 Tax=Saccharothrix tamanrassetensis TaxID=1051531 RepID=A0A841CHY5_9PSEU|nr:hypothetical protein [Saccharothrix tamanrassetensis]MBB5955286.1 hypothetical protein [Saccharothrix tamanrassetensis]
MSSDSSARLPIAVWLIGFAVLFLARIGLRAALPDAPWYVPTIGALLVYALVVVAWLWHKRKLRKR